MKINDEQLYKISDIVKNGWIKNTKNNASYEHIWILVKNGILKAQNRSSNPNSKRPFYMILGKEIKRFKKKVEGL